MLWLVTGGLFMLTLDATIVTTALPAMARSLGESPLSMQSVIVANVMTMALLIPASGWLADRFGTRHTYIAAIVLFTVGSLCCGLADIVVKSLTNRFVTHMGYRNFLVANTLLIGLTIASFAIGQLPRSIGLQVLALSIFGALNSLQLTAMSTLTLKDLGPQTSGGNSVLTIVQMLPWAWAYPAQ